MTERIDQSNLKPAEIIKIKGNFNLHIPTDPSLAPEKFPVHLASREYEDMRSEEDPSKNLPWLRRAELGIIYDEERGEERFAGTIEFDLPAMYRRGEPDLAFMMQKRIFMKLCNSYRGIRDKDAYDISERRGILISDHGRPAIWAEIVTSDDDFCKLNVTGPYRHDGTGHDQLVVISSAVERWVELQEAIIQMEELPFVKPVKENIYVDIDTGERRVSDVEFSLLAAMGQWGLHATLPEWKDDNIDSKELLSLELREYALGNAIDQKSIFELIVGLRNFHETTGYMRPIDQALAVEAIRTCSKLRDQEL